MYGKFFASTFQGSMMAAGPEVFAVWAYVIANVQKGKIELNPRLLAAVIGSTTEKMREAIDKLCMPDSESRSKAEDGRRLTFDSGFQYEVVNHEQYRKIVNADERREYFAQKKREQRAKEAIGNVKNVKDISPKVKNVFDSQKMSRVSTQPEADTETRKRKDMCSSEKNFESFWKAWPRSSRKGGKSECLKVWKAKKLDEKLDAIVQHVELMTSSDDWKKNDGQFIPAPLVYLRGARWEGAETESKSVFEGAI